ncbi:SDR family NAD(P)-dependent oxidoreductase [Mediterraneibacter massiliensis]|uniref:SDR family NAD(P)-dependent oxidoreductase n=1 Tax=Mediterraneibacter massiliensis TaxID=1720300 RepID=UPI00073EB603|nr:SDR family NAD(P)-dependent oxidoreductase [Mediterraneibacter massiliensis]
MKIGIITGASSGIGREFARQMEYFYQTLDEIWVIARRKEKLLALSAQIRVPVRIFNGDLTEKEIYTELSNLLETEKPDIRMLVNAAGFGKSGNAEDIRRKEAGCQSRMIDLNCRALTEMTFVCLPYMSAGSRILNIASAAAFCPQPGFAVYAATKAYVLSFSRALGEEVKNRRIYVTAVCPGPVDTEFFETAGRPESFLKEKVMAEAPQVVRKALLDSHARKSLSIYGLPMKGAQIAAKVLPHRLVLKLEQIGRK